jgi:hypothetical protein
MSGLFFFEESKSKTGTTEESIVDELNFPSTFAGDARRISIIIFLPYADEVS